MKFVNFEPLSPLMFLERASKIYNNRTAFVDRNIRKTFGEFSNDCFDLATSLKSHGVQARDRISYLCRNSYQMIIAHYAVPMLGCILVPINTRLESSSVCHVLDHSGSKMLVAEHDLFNSEYMHFVEKVVLINKHKLEFVNEKILDYMHFISRSKGDKRINCWDLTDENSIISINYTSGTTGQPKGVMCTHRSAYLNALGECLQTGLTNQSKYLWILPMFHCNGWCFTWAVTAVGATNFCTDSLNPDDLVNVIFENKITHLCAAPIILLNILEATNIALLKKCNNIKIVTAGSSPSKKIIEQYKEFNVTIIHVYGLTETYGPHSICEQQDNWNAISNEDLSGLKVRQGVVGVHSTYMRVVNKNMQDVPHDGKSIGEVIMRGNNVMKGYYNDHKSTQNAFRGGWFHSGDAAVVHPDCYIEIKDRIKDIIISGGENISSIEVEKILCQHPAISIAAVVPMFDARWGEVPHAIIELKQEATITSEELIGFCKKHIASYKCPKIITVATLPKTSTGKIKKYILKKKYFYLNEAEIIN